MLRVFAFAVALMVSLMAVLTLFQPVQAVLPVSSESMVRQAEQEGDESGGSAGAADECLNVVSQAIAFRELTPEAQEVDSRPLQEILNTFPAAFRAVDSFRFSRILPTPGGEYEAREYEVALLKRLATISEEVRSALEERNIELGLNLVASTIESEGHSPSQSPFGSSPTSIPITLSSSSAFTNQTAISLMRNTALSQWAASEGYEGLDVKIAVFDTSPFIVSVPESDEPVEINTDAGPIYDFETHVVFRDIEGPSREHGVFVSSLAHVIAPEADLHLYRTLNEDGIGNLYTLVKQLSAFYDQELEPLSDAGLDPIRAVINLSLSIDCNAANYPQDGIGTFASSISSLNEFLEKLHESGVVVVAAAGNNNRPNDKKLRPEMAYPARHIFVTGVGAWQWQDAGGAEGLTCYTNKAEIYAPGGAGAGQDCLPDYNTCLDEAKDKPDEIGDCYTGLVGMVSEGESGLAYWAGTSFATPIVSGMLALALSSDINSSSSFLTVVNDPKGIPRIDVSKLWADLFANFTTPNTHVEAATGVGTPISIDYKVFN